MKTSLLAVSLLLVCVGAGGQMAAVDAGNAGWVWVQSIAAGSKVRLTVGGTVAGTARRQTCILRSVDAGSLLCAKGSVATTFSRSEMVKVEMDHRGRNTGVGAAIGAGVGVAIEQGLSHGLGFRGGKASVAVAAGGLGAISFGALGYSTGWRTIYQVRPPAKP
jgi:hypothetical protein